MTPRSLKIALAVSVALNLFAIGLAAGGVIVGAKLADERRSPRHVTFVQALQSIEPETRDNVHDSMRALALSARPDFQESREARRQAIALARAETFDRESVDALLARSRAAEMRGRTRMETGTVEILSTLEADDRAQLASMLTRHGRRGASRGHRSDGPPPPTPSAPSEASGSTPESPQR